MTGNIMKSLSMTWSVEGEGEIHFHLWTLCKAHISLTNTHSKHIHTELSTGFSTKTRNPLQSWGRTWHKVHSEAMMHGNDECVLCCACVELSLNFWERQGGGQGVQKETTRKWYWQLYSTATVPLPAGSSGRLERLLWPLVGCTLVMTTAQQIPQEGLVLFRVDRYHLNEVFFHLKLIYVHFLCWIQNP